jgi:hypothetical protein
MLSPAYYRDDQIHQRPNHPGNDHHHILTAAPEIEITVSDEMSKRGVRRAEDKPGAGQLNRLTAL